MGSQARIRLGGLLRCCVLSVREYEGPEEPGVTEIPCAYHESSTEPVVRLAVDNVWEWVGRPK